MYIEFIKVLPNVDFYSKFSWDFNQRYLVEETKLVSHPTVFPKVLFLFFFTWTEIPTYSHQASHIRLSHLNRKTIYTGDKFGSV